MFLPLLIGLTALLVVLVIARPRRMTEGGGRAFVFVALFILPALSLFGGAKHHIEKSKTTKFCISCHVMGPYEESLHLDDMEHLPAVHWEKRLIPRDRACYTCHTSYAMYGDIEAKIGGLRHLWVYYFGTIPDKIELYKPYNTRECMHCHEGSRAYLEAEPHVDAWEEMQSGETGCFECHEKTHSIHELKDLKRWKPGEDK